MKALIWKDPIALETVHIGCRYSGNVVPWVTTHEDGIKELFGEDVADIVAVMQRGQLYDVELTARIKE